MAWRRRCSPLHRILGTDAGINIIRGELIFKNFSLRALLKFFVRDARVSHTVRKAEVLEQWAETPG